MSTPHGFHIARMGAGVTDLEIGRAFYGALGFDVGSRFDLGTALGAQSETPGSPLVICVARRDGFDLELVEHGGARPPARPPSRRPLNQLGLAYVALAVDDVDEVCRTIEFHGGHGLTGTRASSLGGDAMFCLDPFGIRLLLLGPAADALGRPATRGDGIALAHVGVCVADVIRSEAFYAALGFDTGPATPLGTTFSSMAELDGADLISCSASFGAYPLVLLQWGAARDPGIPVRLPLNRNGDLIHFGTHCDDFDAMLDVVVSSGGSIVERTRGQFPPPGLAMDWAGEPHGWIFTLDPNGVEIEIVGPRAATAAQIG
jgi:catechol 2,3-dioxygenase-like lactoylglutathione lyase family enzyme